MWKRKELKQKAKEVVKKNYWTAVVVCFLIALLTGEFGTSIIGIWQSDDSMEPYYIIDNSKFVKQKKEQNEQLQNNEDNKQIILSLSKEKIEETLNTTQIKALEAVEANLNNATKSQRYIFKIWDAINFFNINETGLGVTFCISSLVAILFTMFIADPLIVGGKRYFLKARKGEKTKIGIIGDVFKQNNLLNVAIIMLLRNIYNALWYLTIIGGIIKTYEYRMIPFILAENPKIKRKEAFKLSKQMMKGNKWRTFILDMSFFGWNLLSVLTYGLLSILYVNPYNSATMAELYIELRNIAIKEKYEYYEAFNDAEI